MWQEQVQLRRVDQHLLMPVQVPGPLYLFQVFPKEPEKPTLTDITQKEFWIQKVTLSKLTIL